MLSIVAAFLLEGWREDRELARELTQELASVHLEIERNRELVALELAVLERITRAGRSLLDTLYVEPDGEFAPVVDTLAFLGVGWQTTFSPSLGALDGLVASGRLPQVTNAELRLDLAGLRDVLADAVEDEAFARQIAVEQLQPLIGERGDLRPLDLVDLDFFGSTDVEGVTPQERLSHRGLQTTGYVSFPNSPSIRAAVASRLSWLSSAQAKFRQVLRHLERLSPLLEAET
jgi:hypothetical protein